MPDIKKMEVVMSLILTIGMIISMSLVLLGGLFYLLQHGHESMHYDLMNVDYSTSLKLIWQSALSFSPFGMIELGVMVLVATQMIRVGLLAGFYAVIRDYKFLLISLFVFCVLVYSNIFRSS